MNTAEWILVAILSITLLIFLIIGIVLLVVLIKLTKEAQKVVINVKNLFTNRKKYVTIIP